MKTMRDGNDFSLFSSPFDLSAGIFGHGNAKKVGPGGAVGDKTVGGDTIGGKRRVSPAGGAGSRSGSSLSSGAASPILIATEVGRCGSGASIGSAASSSSGCDETGSAAVSPASAGDTNSAAVGSSGPRSGGMKHLPLPPTARGFRNGGGDSFRITISSPAASPRDSPIGPPPPGSSTSCGLLADDMRHLSLGDEPRVVDVSPASGYYEARKPRLRNGGLNARLYNAFRVTTKDHTARSPAMRARSFNGDSPHHSYNSPHHSYTSSPYQGANNSWYSPGGRSYLMPHPKPGGGGAQSGGGPPKLSLNNQTRENYKASRIHHASFTPHPNSSANTSAASAASNASGASSAAWGNTSTATANTSATTAGSTSFNSSAASLNSSGAGGPAAATSAATSAARDTVRRFQQLNDFMTPPNRNLLYSPAHGHGYHGAPWSAPSSPELSSFPYGGGGHGGGMSMPMPMTPPLGIKYKTELCLNWMNTGNCVYGNKCHFGHGDMDLRARKRVRNFKTQMCCDPAREGARRCMFSARCNYLHPSEPLRRAEPVPYFDEDYQAMVKRDFPNNDYPFGIYV